MLAAPFTSKQPRCEIIIEAWGTLTKKLQGDPNLISMAKLPEEGMGLGGMGYHCCPPRSWFEKAYITFDGMPNKNV
jgi:hypothetical protein